MFERSELSEALAEKKNREKQQGNIHNREQGTT
jgi:hypothetical protein